MEHQNLKHLFQQEFAKMVAVITKRFGLHHIEIAEDIATETFLSAAENWQTTGVPPNPTAWLYKVAKQKMFTHLKRNKIFEEKIIPELTIRQETEEEMADLDFSNRNIKDSQLRMIFAICTPAIASEAQIGLALRVLCGFSIDEIAEAFLSNKETINKRLFRAKEKLRAEKVTLDIPGEKIIASRLNNVLHVIYLLFSEGYYSKTNDTILRMELCWEALRLGILLKEHPKTNLPKTNALLALMCFHASRFNARQTGQKISILYDQQDTSLWDVTMIKQGVYFLDLSAQGNEISSYHLEARIAYWHCLKDDSKEKWDNILQLYNQLLLVNYIEAIKLKLEHNHFYYLLLGELYTTIDNAAAKLNYEKAYDLAKTKTEKQLIKDKIREMINNIRSQN
jgi:RNA polymerase sigma factor (sigma-70 family)